jgi:hypothetical protein
MKVDEGVKSVNCSNECIAISCYLSFDPKIRSFPLSRCNIPTGHRRACRQERLGATCQLGSFVWSWTYTINVDCRYGRCEKEIELKERYSKGVYKGEGGGHGQLSSPPSI